MEFYVLAKFVSAVRMFYKHLLILKQITLLANIPSKLSYEFFEKSFKKNF